MNRAELSHGKPKLLRFLSSGLFRAMISALLMSWIVYRFQFGSVISNMWRADKAFLVGALLVFVVSGALGAVQWAALLRFHGIALGFAGTVARYFMGLFFNYILPGFVGGDVVRVYKTAMVSGRASQSFSSTLADRVIGLLALVLFSLGAFMFLPAGATGRALPAAAFMFLVLAGCMALFAVRSLGSIVSSLFGRFVPDGIAEKIAAVYEEMHLLTRSPATLARTLALSFLIQFTRIGVHYLCARAVGIPLGFAYFALFVPVMEILASLPFSFGGVGVREMAGVGLFSSLGVSQESILSYTLLAYTVGFTGSLPGAFAFAFSVGSRR